MLTSSWQSNKLKVQLMNTRIFHREDQLFRLQILNKDEESHKARVESDHADFVGKANECVRPPKSKAEINSKQ